MTRSDSQLLKDALKVLKEAETPLSKEAVEFMVRRNANGTVASEVMLQAIINRPWVISGGNKEYREFVSECLDKLAAESESEPL